MKSEWSGTLLLIAQPAEEVGLGAQAMVADKLWDGRFPEPDFALGAHTAPGPVGVVASAPGVRMAAWISWMSHSMESAATAPRLK